MEKELKLNRRTLHQYPAPECPRVKRAATSESEAAVLHMSIYRKNLSHFSLILFSRKRHRIIKMDMTDPHNSRDALM
jgi:hypothetical protein